MEIKAPPMTSVEELETFLKNLPKGNHRISGIPKELWLESQTKHGVQLLEINTLGGPRRAS